MEKSSKAPSALSASVLERLKKASADYEVRGDKDTLKCPESSHGHLSRCPLSPACFSMTIYMRYKSACHALSEMLVSMYHGRIRQQDV
jgi:hypothetical protein